MPLATEASATAAQTAPAAVIRTDKLSKTFSNAGTQQHVLKNLDLEIEERSFTVIMGPSGSGKSTLLYALSGLDRPTLGSVTVAGTDISRFSEDRLARFRRTHCGFVFQQIHLLDSMTVMDNVMAVGLLTSRDRAAVRRHAEELLELVGLAPADRRKFPSMLSGGEAQRVGIARGLINSPTVLFADEPTGQLNSEYGRLVLDLLTQVHEAGQTVVMVTHDLRSAARGGRILYLRDGTITGAHRLDPAAADAERTQRTAGFLAEMGW
ncbi:MAG: ABC transporter ATP-binding protein [Propionibacteriaceae bacterium]|nr:ABC transporter ATP-binding protein [Propionibacteriaceae bacterium]